MVAVMEKEDAPRALGHQEREQRRVGLGGVAGTAGQDEVVGPVVGGLATARPDMVERDGVDGNPGATIGAHRSVALEEPVAMRTV